MSLQLSSESPGQWEGEINLGQDDRIFYFKRPGAVWYDSLTLRVPREKEWGDWSSWQVMLKKIGNPYYFILFFFWYKFINQI